MTRIWKHVLARLENDGPRLYAGVAGDEPDLLDAARASGSLAVGFRDQRAATYAAAGYARMSGRAAVVTLHSGPGFLQALGGISEAYSTATPMLVITLASRESERGRGGFQHIPVERYDEGLFAAVHVARSSEDLDRALARAIYLSEVACRAPIHVVVDADLAADGDVPVSTWPTLVPVLTPRHDMETLGPVVRALCNAERPVLILGGGCRSSSDFAHVRADAARLAHNVGASVFVTASGRGSFPEEDPHFAGLMGLYAPAEGLQALEAADLIVTVGSRLEETARMGWTLDSSTLVVQVDIDPRSLVRSVPVSTAVVADAADFLKVTAQATNGNSGSVWWTPFAPYPASSLEETLDAPTVWQELSRALKTYDLDVLAQENGLADLWGYYAPVCTVPGSVTTLTPGEQTALGFGITAGLGAALAGARVLAVGGDGAFSVNLTTIATAAEHRADILFVVLDDGGFGWPASTRSDTTLADFSVPSGAGAVANAAGILCERASSVPALHDAINRLAPIRDTRLLVLDIATRVLFPPEGTITA